MRKYFWVPIVLGLSAYVLLPLPGSSKTLPQKIEEKQGQIESKKRVEGVLTTTITRYNGRIRGLQGEIAGTTRQLNVVQSELDRKREELLQIRDELEVARDQLEKARAKLKLARAGLADRLVELYKSDQPDALTVVLEADGFADLLERTEFLERISDRDREIVDRVRVLKARFEREEEELASLEGRAQIAAEQVLERRDTIASARDRLATAQGELRSARNDRAGALATVRQSRVALEGDLRGLQAAQARVTSQLSGTPTGPIRRGSGSLIWPVNGSVVSPFGMRWGRLHAGIDIAAGTGTPIRAADSGTVILLGVVSGYGNYTCVGHGGGLSTCYAHQTSYATSQGANVSQGQVIGYVGCTGHCFGPHLHFETRVNGSPVDPMGYL